MTDILAELGVTTSVDISTKKYLKISNSGEVDPLAFELIGASTKRGDTTKIGYFGSGLKYSIAYLLRNNIPFVVYAGKNPIVFGTKKQDLRGSNFDAITINDKVTSLTIQMGIDWELWFAIREIVCNAMDEPGYKIEHVQEIECIENVTSFYIEVTPEITVILKDWKKYFSEDRTDMLYYTTNGFKIFPSDGVNLVVYRKGIQCYFTQNNASFHYDSPVININESRVIKYSWDLDSEVCRELKTCTNKKIIEMIYMRICGDVYEKDLSWDSNANQYSVQWLEVIDNRILVSHEMEGHMQEEIMKNRAKYLVLPTKMCHGLCDRFPEIEYAFGNRRNKDVKPHITVEKTPKVDYILKEVTKILSEMKYEINYPIDVVTFVDKKILGQANIQDQRILICSRAFDMGRRKIAEILMEEQEHLITELSDETRNFQNHWIQLFISEKEERFGIFL